MFIICKVMIFGLMAKSWKKNINDEYIICVQGAAWQKKKTYLLYQCLLLRFALMQGNGIAKIVCVSVMIFQTCRSSKYLAMFILK